MASRKVHKQSRLPRTSRVNEKIIEYYTKFGKDRDLEKFMRLYSPNSNLSCSKSTSSSCGFSDDEAHCAALRRLFMLNNPDCDSISGSSKSLPSMDLYASENDADGKKTTGATAEKDHIIEIHLEKNDPDTTQMNVEENKQDILITPKKIQSSQSKQTQTPDSIAKTHKRLEWDSLGDVGYRKSMSTSNISILERSLLRELFHDEIPSTSVSNKKTVNTSEGDLKELQREKLVEQEIENTKLFEHQSHNTPPLASSTFVNPKIKHANSAGILSETRPKYMTQGTSTSTSLLKKYEKFVQTTMTKPSDRPASRHSKEIQVNMSSATPSMIGSSATPSSFEYCGSLGSNATSTCNSATGHHRFAAEIAELLLKRKVLKDSNKKYKLKYIESSPNSYNFQSLAEALNDNNKENSTPGVPTKIPQLDLGIQLLCSLIDARSLNKDEKKQLVRDIVKRISRISGSNSEEASIGTSRRESRDMTLEQSTNSSVNVSQKGNPQSSRNAERKNFDPKKKLNSDEIFSEQLIEKHVYNTPSSSTTKKAQKEHKLVTDTVEKTSSKQEDEPLLTETQNKNLQAIVKKDNVLKNKLDKVNKETLIELKSHEAGKSLEKNVKKQIKSSQTVSSSSTASTTSSSKNLTTQKEVNNSTDADATMGDWLNPLTQSEIEYERKKIEHSAKKREKLLQRQKKSSEKSEFEREAQLNWIETEIERLESLKNLLLKVELNDNTDEKIYDTVHSEENQETSSVLNENAELLIKEIEVIIEESNEDVINLEKNLKRTKERKRETQIIYDKPTVDEEIGGVESRNNARFRTMKETITINEEQVLPIIEEEKTKAPIQRSKIDTPSSSNDSESVCSFVKQRKREFLEHYKNIKKSHYEALSQNQHHHKRQQEHINEHFKSIFPGIPRETTSGHYSVPQTIQRTYPKQNNHHFYYHTQPHHYEDHYLPQRPPPPPPPPPVPPHVVYNPSAGLTSAQYNNNNINTNSSSSMFCVSSEISIPMGSNTTSSTTTTTHQYDDVAAGGVGIQTSDSIRGSHPIFGRRQVQTTVVSDSLSTVSYKPSGQSISIQVKPQSIAYVVSFDAKSKEDVSPIQPTTTPKSEEGLTLQDYLQRAKPKFCAQSKKRKAILNKIQALRQERERELRAIVDNTSINSLDRRLMKLPPPPTKYTRIFPTKEMKAMTNKRYALLPEVLDKQEREREERRKRSNRLLRDVFNKRLQNRVRHGKLSLNHSKTVI